MKPVEDLKAWHMAMELIVGIYDLTKKFPKEELYGITSQLRRAAVSIATNIAEGFGRFTYADKANKYTIARGECAEVRTLLHVVVQIALAKKEDVQKYFDLAEQASKLLSGLINSCKDRDTKNP